MTNHTHRDRETRTSSSPSFVDEFLGSLEEHIIDVRMERVARGWSGTAVEGIAAAHRVWLTKRVEQAYEDAKFAAAVRGLAA